MDTHTILAIVFILGMGLFLYVRRSALTVQKILGPIIYFAMYRASWGLGAMDALANWFPRFMRWLFYSGIVIGFLGMGFISYEIIKNTVNLFTQPELAPGIQPVLPIAVKGVFYVPFAYWIISIFVIAAIHEFAHGVAARAHNIPVKSSGFAFLGIILPVIPAAFVEPDEKKLIKRPMRQQLSVFAAGPLANILLAFLVIFVFGFQFPGIAPETSSKIALVDLPSFADGLTQWNGLTLTGVTPGSPAAAAGLIPGETITAIDDVPVTDRAKLVERLNTIKPQDAITLTTKDNVRPLVVGSNPDDASRPWIGIQFDAQSGPTPSALARYGERGTTLILGGITLLVFIYALSLGIGLFNLLPLGPLDGGRMFQLAAERILGPSTGHAAWKYMGFFFLGLIILNLTIGFVR